VGIPLEEALIQKETEQPVLFARDHGSPAKHPAAAALVEEENADGFNQREAMRIDLDDVAGETVLLQWGRPGRPSGVDVSTRSINGSMRSERLSGGSTHGVDRGSDASTRSDDSQRGERDNTKDKSRRNSHSVSRRAPAGKDFTGEPHEREGVEVLR
jgi:hypothetical protein